MGLKVSHGAFDASYSAFNRFRRFILTSIGGSYPPHKQKGLDNDRWYWGTDMLFSNETHKGLKEFLSHSDCDGEISSEMCKIVADELESILPYVQALEEKEPATGQLLAFGGYTQVTKDFIIGCRKAHHGSESLEFL